MSPFVEAAGSAFSGLASEYGWALGEASESEWFASVDWLHAEQTLSVSDDRRDRVVEVHFSRPVGLRKDRVALPLWAVVEAAGGSAAEAFAAGDLARRIEALPRLAAVTSQYGGPLLSGDWSMQDVVIDVMERQNQANSEEGRRARRFLP